MSRHAFGWAGDRATCRWCGRKLRIELEYGEPGENLAAELTEWLKNKPDGSGWHKHPEIGRFRAYAHGRPGVPGSRFSVPTGRIKVGVWSSWRHREPTPIGEHPLDSAFDTWKCGTLFADRMVAQGRVFLHDIEGDAVEVDDQDRETQE